MHILGQTSHNSHDTTLQEIRCAYHIHITKSVGLQHILLYCDNAARTHHVPLSPSQYVLKDAGAGVSSALSLLSRFHVGLQYYVAVSLSCQLRQPVLSIP